MIDAISNLIPHNLYFLIILFLTHMQKLQRSIVTLLTYAFSYFHAPLRCPTSCENTPNNKNEINGIENYSAEPALL